MKFLISFFLLIFLPTLTFAFESVQTPGGDTGSGTGISSQQALEVGKAAGDGAKGINESGNKTASRQMITGGITTTVGIAQIIGGAVIISGCKAATVATAGCEVPGWILVISGTAGVGQGGLQMSSAGGSRDTANAAGFRGVDYQGNPYEIDTPDGTTTVDDLLNKANAALNNAKKNGITIDPKTGKATLPNGKVVDPSALGSAAGVAGAFGISEAEAQKALDQANKKNSAILAKYGDLDKYKLSFAGGGGGGAGDGGGRGPASEGFKFNFGGGGNRKPAQAKVAGLQKIVGGATVGVASDDIFQMVKRKYEEKNKTDFFAK